MKIFQNIQKSFTTQLSLWVAGFVLVISVVVIILLVRFSQDVIRAESIETTQQALKNYALRIDNTVRQAKLSARLEHRRFKADMRVIEQLIADEQITIDTKKPYPRLCISDSAAAVGTSRQLLPDGSRYMFYEPICDRQYSVVMTCTASDIFSQYTHAQLLLMGFSVVCILLLLYICFKVIAWHLRPLHVLADAAQHIANGHINETIPDNTSPDETGQLQHSLSRMQRSLAAYMGDMRQKQALLSRQNVELQRAYKEVQEYEDLKAKFLHDMTGQMVNHVDTLCRNTDAIYTNYKTLSAEETGKLQKEMLVATEAITWHLEKLLNDPAQKNLSTLHFNTPTPDAP